MNEKDDSECPFNYAKNLDREQLETIANAVLGPLIENRVAFEQHYTLQIEGADECFEDIVDLLVKPNIGNQVASRKPAISKAEALDRVSVWLTWLEGVVCALEAISIWSGNEATTAGIIVPTAIVNPEYEGCHESLKEILQPLSEEDYARCQTLIESIRVENASYRTAIQTNFARPIYRDFLGAMDEFSKRMDEIQKQFRQTLEQTIGEEHVLDWEFSWRQFSKDQRLKILKAIACRKEAEEKLRASISFEWDNGAERRIFERHIETKLPLEKQLVEILGEKNTEYLLAGFLDRLTEDIDFQISYLDALRDLQSEFAALANGEKTPFTRALLKRGRGARNDAHPIRHLKNRVGDVYRALRTGCASSDQAVDTINAVLRNNGQPGMTKDAIQSRVPGDLLDLSPYDPIHYVRPVLKGKKLPRKPGESFEASLERHARRWLRPALHEANRTAGN